MNKLKKVIFISLIYFSLIFSDEIIENFFIQVRKLKDTVKNFRIETIESKILGEIKFSEQSYNLIKDPFQNLFQKNLPKNLKIDGYIRGKFSPESDKLEFEYLYVYLSSEIDNFIISQIKNDIQILIPSLGIIIKDKKENFKNFEKKQEINSEKNFLPVNFLEQLFSFLMEKEDEIKSNLEFKEEKKRDNLKTFVYGLRVPEGVVNFEILENFYTLSSIEIFNNKENTTLILNYPIPEKEIKVTAYLPSSIEIKSQKDKNITNLYLTNIKYNRLFSENDFKIKEINFLEMINLIFLKAIKKNIS
ncbi:MAG: hypothetical protein NC827_05230 [Candidatus Omnitrophica bacterium]|nr:hypothetical protein [Candidatus Omnitrophota bacterium]MCM8802692.1 hypothetical protein [Candidatus Omnitrophota bacterium]